MRVIIETGAYKFHNFGDTAMMLMAVERIKKLFPEASIFIFTEEPIKIKKIFKNATAIFVQKPDPRLREEAIIFPELFFSKLPPQYKLYLEGMEVKIIKLLPEFILNLVKKLKKIFKLRKKNYTVYQEIEKSNLVLMSGGGVLTDAFYKHTKRALTTLEYASRCNIPAVMVGQGIGPFQDNKLKNLISSKLKNVDLIAIREKLRGVNLLKSLGIDEEKIRVTGDDAIELAYNGKTDDLGNHIGINIRAAFNTNINEADKTKLKNLIISKAKELSVNLISLPILNETKYSDIETARVLFGNYRRFKDANLNYDQLEKLLERFTECKLVITGSYHSGVFALARGIPSIVLVKSEYYFHKFNGLADMFGKGCFIVPLYNKNFTKKFTESFEEAWDNAESYRNNLFNKAKEQIEISKSVYNEIANLVNLRMQNINL